MKFFHFVLPSPHSRYFRHSKIVGSFLNAHRKYGIKSQDTVIRDSTIYEVKCYVADVLDVVFFLLGDSPVSEFYVPTFWNTFCQFHLHRSYEQEE
jgi:hypothetical protein